MGGGISRCKGFPEVLGFVNQLLEVDLPACPSSLSLSVSQSLFLSLSLSVSLSLSQSLFLSLSLSLLVAGGYRGKKSSNQPDVCCDQLVVRT